ncbi:MAG: hypothetical protein VZR33_08275 [Methanosphaera sp.]|nr:hypothetical protein [Methanosphaera sp.]
MELVTAGTMTVAITIIARTIRIPARQYFPELSFSEPAFWLMDPFPA